MSNVIVHHSNCPDGFGSAWLLAQHLLGPTEIVAASYGDAPPEVDGHDVYCVDFCFEAPDLVTLANHARTLTILDHHQTALGYVDAAGIPMFGSVKEYLSEHDSIGVPGAKCQVKAIVDMDRSGVGLVMEYTGAYVPFLAHVEDRDLWRFNLPYTAEVFAAVTSRPYTTEAWDWMESVPLEDLITEGKAIQRYRDKLIADTVATAWRGTLPTGHDTWMVASPYAIGSDVAGELAKRDPEGFAAYYVHYGNRVRFGLRSGPDGVDVAKIAEVLGGGGHQHASGFEVDASDWCPA
jgi:uncharacterized protein